MGGGKSKLRKNLKKKEIKRFVEETHFNHDEIVALYEHFKDIAASQDNDGVIDQHEFMEALNIQESVFADRIFGAFDENDDEAINFREFVCGVSIFAKGTLDEKLDLSFKIYDQDGDGAIDKEELFKILKASVFENFLMDMTEDQMRELVDSTFAATDTNGDGLISYEEYRDMVYQHPDVLKNFQLDSDVLLGLMEGEDDASGSGSSAGAGGKNKGKAKGKAKRGGGSTSTT